VDQVIEKVSFCSPDRNFDKGESFVYFYKNLVGGQGLEMLSVYVGAF
jgi:hypothetical protein